MADKGFKTVEEQLDILHSCGLTINDGAQARGFFTAQQLLPHQRIFPDDPQK